MWRKRCEISNKDIETAFPQELLNKIMRVQIHLENIQRA